MFITRQKAYANLRYLIIYSLAVVATMTLCVKVYADSSIIDTSTTFRQAISITNVTDFDFGIIEFTPGAGAANVTISPVNGNITCSNTANYSCPAAGTRGSFAVTGSTGATIEIGCATGGRVSDGTNRMNYNMARLSVNSGNTLCRGVDNSIALYTLTGDIANDTIYMGARLRIRDTGVVAAGLYTSGQAGGFPLEVRVVYQ